MFKKISNCENDKESIFNLLETDVCITSLRDEKTNFKNKSILITGATGSFSKSFVKLITEKYPFRRIIIFSRDELKQFEMKTNDILMKQK